MERIDPVTLESVVTFFLALAFFLGFVLGRGSRHLDNNDF